MSRFNDGWVLPPDERLPLAAYLQDLHHPRHDDFWARIRATLDPIAAPEAERLTPSAEPDALTPVVMSGGAEPAGAAKHPESHAA